MKNRPVRYILILLWLVTACQPKGERQAVEEVAHEPLKHLTFTADLRKDSAAIAEYLRLHSSEGVWPEIARANERSGIQEVSIYRMENRLFMVVSIPQSADMAVVDSLYQLADPERLKAWGELTNSLLKAPPGVDTTLRWIPMERIYHYPEN